MAARNTPSKGSKPDKLIRDAIMVALHRDDELPDGTKAKKINVIATKLVNMAIDGDIQAIKEINDRVDGKATQVVAGDDDNPLKMVTEIRLIGVSADR